MNSQQTDYNLDNQTLYPRALMERRFNKVFITIPHTDLTVSEALEKFKTYDQVTYCKVAQEHHEDGDTHIHIYMAFKQQVRTLTIHNMLKQIIKRIIGTINYQTPKNPEAINKYLDKEGNTAEFGERPTTIGKSRTEDKNSGYREAIQAAQTGNTAEALQILLEEQPRDMMINGENIKYNLENLRIRKKFDIPIYTKDNTIFKKWQQQLLNLVNTTPVKRRIIWVVGEPESGKTFIHDYLSNLENFEYGLYQAGQSVSYDNVIYGYDEEGIIAFDFPKSYDWLTFGDQAANIIEKFSDFGTKVSSKKYKGSTKHIRGHCLVFSNREPLEGIQHRDVVVIRASKEDSIVPSMFKIQNKKDIQVQQTTDNPPINAVISTTDTQQTPDHNTVNIQIDSDTDSDTDGEYYPQPFTKYNYFCPPPKLMERIEDIEHRLNTRLAYLTEHNINGDEQKTIIKKMNELEARRIRLGRKKDEVK